MHPDEPLICTAGAHEAARYVIARMIRHAGFPVVEADTGAHALTLVRRDRPALVILDLQLPDIRGDEVCRRLKADPATAAIAVVLTSSTFAAREPSPIDPGPDAILPQPFTEDELLATVRTLLRRKHRDLDPRHGARDLDFLGMLDHELRNPLAAVSGALGILARRPARDPAEQRARDIARRQMARLTRVVDHLLALSRLMRGGVVPERAPLDLRELLDAAIDMSEKTCRDGHALKFSRTLPAHPVVVDGDRTMLARVLACLLEHATRYAGGAVDTELAVEAGSALVRVRDDGVGIAPDALGGLFDIFYQSGAPVRRSAAGLGLGLSLAHALVELHGGSFVARSEGPGRGTTLEVRLPVVAAAPSPTPPPRPVSTAGERRSSARVVIVEDDPDTRVALRDLCRAWGHEALAAGDGLLGVELALRCRPDVAIIDLGLPHIDGFEVARRIRADPRGAAVRLVALTSFASPELRDATAAAGFALHIVKPADPEQLAEFIAPPPAAAFVR